MNTICNTSDIDESLSIIYMMKFLANSLSV